MCGFKLQFLELLVWEYIDRIGWSSLSPVISPGLMKFFIGSLGGLIEIVEGEKRLSRVNARVSGRKEEEKKNKKPKKSGKNLEKVSKPLRRKTVCDTRVNARVTHGLSHVWPPGRTNGESTKRRI